MLQKTFLCATSLSFIPRLSRGEYTGAGLLHSYSLCTMFRSSGGYAVTRLQCKVFQINRPNVCHLCSFLSPLNHCVYKIVCNQWAARCGFEEPSWQKLSTLQCAISIDQAAATFSHFHSTQHHGELVHQSSQFSVMQYHVYIRLIRITRFTRRRCFVCLYMLQPGWL